MLLAAPASAANQDIACIQKVLNEVGYDSGPVDGLLGKRTRGAVEKYIEESQLTAGVAPSFFDDKKLVKQNAPFWCRLLSSRHPVSEHADTKFRKAASFGYLEFWQSNRRDGWDLRMADWAPGKRRDNIVVFVDGDGGTPDAFRRNCLHLGSNVIGRSSMACIYRPLSANGRKIRQPEEVNAFVNVLKTVEDMFPDSALHCLGHSSGGHLCLAAAQQQKFDLGCLVGSAPVSANKLFVKLRSGKLHPVHRRAYDPLDHVEKTKAEDIIIVGDREDPVVSHKVWDVFIEAAAEAGIDVDFVAAPGLGHNVADAALLALNRCLLMLPYR